MSDGEFWKTPAVIALAIVLCCALSMWRDVEVARATGKEPSPGLSLRIRAGVESRDGGAGGAK